MTEEPQGCARTTGAVAGDKSTFAPVNDITQPQKETIMTARVRQKAPVYYQGSKTIRVYGAMGIV